MIKYLEENDDFKRMINDKKVLVDFYAEWCGPCKMMATVLEKVDFIDVIKIDVDRFPDIAKEYGVMSIPTLIVFENGVEKEKTVGFTDIEVLKEMVE